MPLNGHSYLVSQGWSGHGSGLREGAISRPLAIPQKRTLAGLGKDRDEAFPFWDHLFDAAAKAIQVKIFNDDDDDSNTDNDETPVPDLNRTSTGLLSNRRPILSTPASSGTATPHSINRTEGQKLSLLATAKRAAAKKGLYSRFFRGPVLGPETEVDVEVKVASTSMIVTTDEVTTSVCEGYASGSNENAASQNRRTEKKKKADRMDREEKKEKKKSKDKKRDKGKERAKDGENTLEDVEGVPTLADKTRKEKRAKRKRKDQADSSMDGESGENKERKQKRRKDENPDDTESGSAGGVASGESKEGRRKRRKEEKEERRRRKEEKRKRKEKKYEGSEIVAE